MTSDFTRFLIIVRKRKERRAESENKCTVTILEFSISDSLSQQFFPVSTDVEFDFCGICVCLSTTMFSAFSIYFDVYFSKTPDA
jgi:hypothetical protein